VGVAKIANKRRWLIAVWCFVRTIFAIKNVISQKLESNFTFIIFRIFTLTFVSWATVCKTNRFVLCYQTVVCPVCLVCLSCLSLCDVGVLWPNGCVDQDESWQAGIPQPWPHCVRRSPQFSPCRSIGCGHMAIWIKMPVGVEVGLDPATLC